MSLPDTLERVGVVVGSILMVGLPTWLVLQAVFGTSLPWWGLVALLAPGFVVGWAVASERAPFDYDTVWFVCFLGYVLALVAIRVLGLLPIRDHTAGVVAVVAVTFGVAALADHYWR